MSKIEESFRDILEEFGKTLDFLPEEEQIENTPKRLGKMYGELLQGYTQSPKDILSKRFKSASKDMVIVKDIPFVSLCAHHWLPFMGTCSIAYIPKKKEVVGLSKIPRLVQCFARRLQVQENMTTEIADALYKELNPEGCIVVTKAKHMCAEIRGVQTKNSEMIVSSLRGCFNKEEVKQEFINLLKV